MYDMNKQIQFIQVSPEELESNILKGVDKRLSELKKDFQPKEPTELLTRKEVAQLLKCDVSTVYRWTEKGLLKKYGIGNAVYYKRSEVEQALIELKH